jgi:hypothetical protein
MRTILFLLISLVSTAQCEIERIGTAYLDIPGFFNLYFTDQCISQNMSDTTICIKVPRQAQGQVAAFSYSSPNGAPAFVTEVRQYDSSCEFIEFGSLIASGTDTITVCYDIQATLIDNFCPYMILAGGLSVEWCGIGAYLLDELAHVRFVTCSNAGTKHFEVIWSKDAYNWQQIGIVTPNVQTTSYSSDYNFATMSYQAGDNYYAVREIDLNGRARASDYVYLNIPYPIAKENGNFDLLGRQVNSSRFMYYVQPK